jgi:hypothetical protein
VELFDPATLAVGSVVEDQKGNICQIMKKSASRYAELDMSNKRLSLKYFRHVRPLYDMYDCASFNYWQVFPKEKDGSRERFIEPVNGSSQAHNFLG